MEQTAYLIHGLEAYNFLVRPGAKKITIEFSWTGLGNVSFQLISPSKTYTESEMEIFEKVTINVSPIMTTYRCLKRGTLEIKREVPALETWTVRIIPSGITEYQLSIETS
ncbi:MAG: hypothetical protein QXG01_04795 [Candidatus Bathyarchaeia archaeon]